ncbi:hypothetical protein KR093_002419 [Drosophila rubida]|uniref:FAD dependent oxidoreductase domain-containing protein n=1 Tax=Drosophila rubida TaxID=30044 RepID=A0AAD4K4Y5_9MUSC|nr:hypothetical protein KR093_002419 [Drosophila rubida]
MLRCRRVIRLLQVPLHRACSTGANKSKGADNGGGTSTKEQEEDTHPIRRTFRLLGNDMRKIKEFFLPPENEIDNQLEYKKGATSILRKFGGDKGNPDEFQTHCDVLVIGGGGIGSSIAYWLKQKARTGLNVVVVEQDDTYAKSSVHVSTGALCQQFSLPENIQMALFGAEFMRKANDHFGPDIPLNFVPHGQLVLAKEADAAALQQSSQLQNELGARNQLLTPDRLRAKFPWLNCQDIALGCLSLEGEGWFDSWALLTNLRRAACGYGAHFVHGRVIDFQYQSQEDIIVSGDTSGSSSYQSLDKVVVQLADGSQRAVKFALCVIAAGSESSKVARLAHIGQGGGILQVPLPIDARQRHNYVISTEQEHVPSGTMSMAMTMPMIVDPSGTFLRRHGLGGQYICGHTANSAAAADASYFDAVIRPSLAKRIPAFEAATIVHSASGIYDYNVYDENGILGAHPYYHNLYLATGFSGQGMQQAPAVGRAISELIMDGQFRTLDLTRLGFDRLIVDKPMYEFNALNSN